EALEKHVVAPRALPSMLIAIWCSTRTSVKAEHVNWLPSVYRRPNTSKPAPGHRIYPYLLRGLAIDRPNQVWVIHITSLAMARGFVNLSRHGLAGFCRGECRSRWRRHSASRRWRRRWLVMALLNCSASSASVRSPLIAASARQRCLPHKLRNLQSKVPEDQWPEFKARAIACYQAASPALARLLRDDMVSTYGAALPSALACLQDDFEACI